MKLLTLFEQCDKAAAEPAAAAAAAAK